jgi:ornithine cyclodeaminase
MRILDASAVEGLETGPLVERLREMFRSGGVVPPRHHHTIPVTGGADATLLLMPAWQPGRYLGTKVVTVFPSNSDRGLPAVAGTYVLMSGHTGEPLVLIDGRMLTLRRTAAASALAARYLARQDAHRLLMVGTGALAPHLIMAHASVRPIKEVLIWGRNADKARRLARSLSNRYLTVTATDDLEGATGGADVISCATLSHEPLIRGEWLKPGQHLDLVGGFTPAMRETDDTAIERARVYVDTPMALQEAGDIVQPLQSGVLLEKSIAGDLGELTQGRCHGRSFYNQITLFKSVGTALEDLAAAILLFESTRAEIPTLR